MFKKPFKVRTNNAIRGSERKKLRANLSRQMPGLSDEDLLLIVPTKDDMTVKKLTTHNDLLITCYCNHSNPILFETDSGRLLPTVYLLWQVQLNILSLETHPPVFNRIFGGADLLMAGVVKPENGWPTFQTNAPCYVSLKTGNCAAVSVGSTSCSSDELETDGLHDKRVKIFHCYKDFLWASGDKSDPPFIASPPPPSSSFSECTLGEDPAEEGVCTSAADDGDDCLEHGEETDSVEIPTELTIRVEELVEEELAIDRLDIDSETTSDSELRNTFPNCTPVSTGGGTNLARDCTDINTQVDINQQRDRHSQAETNLLRAETNLPQVDTQADMDALLENCFFQALLSMKKVELPLLVSNFSSVYLHAACPAGERIDVRKSSHKKMARFLQTVETRGVVEVRELITGVASITAINFECESLREFQKSDFARQAKLRKKEQSRTAATSNEDNDIKIRPVYSVSAPTTPFFRLFDRPKGAVMKGEEVRSCVTEYVNGNELSTTNKKQVQLDALLSDVLLSKGERIETMPWNEIMKRMCNAMNECHEISLPGLPPEIRKGNPQNIQISTQQRMGNKMITLIDNLELFGIDVKAFAHNLQQAAASSTTVNTLPGKTQEKLQVQAQGNQLKHANKLLDQLHIPSKYVSEKGGGGGGGKGGGGEERRKRVNRKRVNRNADLL